MEPFTFRPVIESEHPKALALWQTVFTETPGFFERYFRADFGYQEGDTLGAWRGDDLVSAVHLCRRSSVWRDDTLLCGAVANVATLPDARRRGLSRRLLEMTIAKMEREGFHFSLLGTGVPGHYAALGWEQTYAPRTTLGLQRDLPPSEAAWQALAVTAPLLSLYGAHPRPLQFVRSGAYFEGWAGWLWGRSPAFRHLLPDGGYIVLDIPEDDDDWCSATEWRASDAATEQALLRAAAAEALRRGRTQLALGALPQFVGEDFLNMLGPVITQKDTGGMVRNVSLPEDRYQQLLQMYRSGEAVWWSADGF